MAIESLISLSKIKNWNKIVEINKVIKQDIPLSAFDLGIEMNYQFVVVLVSTTDSKSTWNFGGEIRQVFYDSKITTQSVQFATNPLRLNVPELIQLKKIALNRFGLIFYPPKWFTNVKIEVWEYTGIVVNIQLEDLVLNTDFSGLESALEQLKKDLAANQDNTIINQQQLIATQQDNCWKEEINDDYLPGYY